MAYRTPKQFGHAPDLFTQVRGSSALSALVYRAGMLAKRLLELQAEFTNAEQDSAALASAGLPPARTHDEIAKEYGQVLKAFLKG